MKKLGKLKLHDAVVISDGEMKNITGGLRSPRAICIAKCHGHIREVSTSCDGGCTAEDYVRVSCYSNDGIIVDIPCPVQKP